METLTVDFLKIHDCCPSSIHFAVRNKLIGMPLDWGFLDSIYGDHENYLVELMELLKLNKKTIAPQDSSTKTRGEELDLNGNLTKETHKDGSVWEYEYDHCGNLTLEKFCGRIKNKWQYEYDANENISKEILPSGYALRYQYTHHPNGQLRQIFTDGELTLEIPLF